MHENMKLYKGYEAVTGVMISVECIPGIIKKARCDSNIEQAGEQRTMGYGNIEIKREGIPIDNITRHYDEITADGDKADVALSVVGKSDIVKEEVLDEASVNDVDDSRVRPGEVGSDGVLRSGRKFRRYPENAREETDVKKNINQRRAIRHRGTKDTKKHRKNVKLSCDPRGYENDNKTQSLSHSKAHAKSMLHNCNSGDFKTKSKKTKKTIRHLCNVCEMSFSTNRGLGNHLRIHMRKDRSCDICKKSFRRDSTLKTHMRIHCGKPYTCGICKRSYSSKSYLRSHMVKHSGDEQYSCDVCKKSFLQKWNLQIHTLTHDKRFACGVCDKSFSHKYSLQNHMLAHSGVKPFTCEICDKSFLLKTNLKRHLLIHSGDKPYTCDVCNKVFTAKFSLDQHMLIHSGDKPYTCDVCDKSFRVKSNFRRHTLVHKNDKRHSCKLCTDSFRRISQLKIHMFIHTGARV